MKKGFLLLLGIILIVLLSYFCFMGKAQGIKEDLVSQSHVAYKAEQIDWIDVSIKGDELEMTRTLILKGVAPSIQKREEVEIMARAIDGVLDVDNQLIIKEKAISIPSVSQIPKIKIAKLVEPVIVKPKVIVPSPYTISVIKGQSNQITLSGYVPNSNVHTDLVNQAKALAGVDNVIDVLKEIEGSPDEWKESATHGMTQLAVVDYGRYNMSDTTFYFEGYVGSEEQKSKLLTVLNDKLSKSYNGTYDIETPKAIAIPSPYTITVVKEESKQIILNGYVPNSEVHSQIVSSANTLFGNTNVTDNLKEVIGSPVAWEESSLLGLEKLHLLDYGQFSIEDTSFDFSGYVGSEDKKALILTNLKEKLNNNYTGIYEIKSPIPVIVVPSFSCQKEFKTLLLKEKIHFEYDKATIKKSSYGLLDQLIDIANQCPDSNIEIEGHTDSDGSKQYNQKLSFKRANAVRIYLIKNNIQDSRLKAIGYGEVNPVATNKTSHGKEQNRRIEFNVKGME